MEKRQFADDHPLIGEMVLYPRRMALKITLSYMLAGWLWILFSDRVVTVLTRDPETMVLISNVKGSLFVLVTAGILFVVIYSRLQQIQRTQSVYFQSVQELQRAHKALEASEMELRRQFGELQAKNETIEEKDREMWSLFEHMYDAFAEHEIVLDEQGKPVDFIFRLVNPAYEKLLIRAHGELIGRRALAVFPNMDRNFISVFGEVALTGVNRHMNFYSKLLKKQLSMSLYSPKRGHFALLARDVSKEMAHAQTVERLAYYDRVTGLPNRIKLTEVLNGVLTSETGATAVGALLYIDMDDLKLVNDSYGHSYGDAMIITAAMHLVSLMESGSFVARVGGDEFVVLIPEMTDPDQVGKVAAGYVEILSREYEVRGLQFHASASIGIVMYPQNGDTVEDLLRNADTALYEAKRSGKRCWRFFRQSMQEVAFDQIQLINGLRNALTNRELSVHFQPQISLADGRATAFEALLRWNSPLHGNVGPARFIPLAEKSHLIESIGAWVLKESANFSRKLSSLGYSDIRVAVNISPRQLMAPDFLRVVLDAFDEAELAAGRLEIEITENVFIESMEECVQTLEKLRLLGVHLSLDDFGTGYSSLTYLRSLPVQTVKIDKSFIDMILADHKHSALIGSIIEMAHVLGLAVVAEGVETSEQLEQLVACHCDTMQGYLVSRPVPDATALMLLNEGAWQEKIKMPAAGFRHELRH